MRIAFIARLPAPRQPNAPERPPALQLPLITTFGGSTVVAYFRLQPRLEHELATDSLVVSEIKNKDAIMESIRTFLGKGK